MLLENTGNENEVYKIVHLFIQREECEVQVFQKRKKNIVEIFGSNKERGNYVNIEKYCMLMKSFYSVYSSNLKVIKVKRMT
jgi:hypothetical protein